MKKLIIRLETRTGELVAEKEIPPFNMPPEIILWGDRTFIRCPIADEPQEFIIFREAFAYRDTM